MNERGSDYGALRAGAVERAWKTVRHLLRPDSVHLMQPADLAEAITAANDVLAPAETQLLTELGDVRGDLLWTRNQLERREHELLRVSRQRDDALKVADQLAYAVAEVVGTDIGGHEPDNNPWNRALSILEDMAVANRRWRARHCQQRAGGSSWNT
jgi:hypothetical protein